MSGGDFEPDEVGDDVEPEEVGDDVETALYDEASDDFEPDPTAGPSTAPPPVPTAAPPRRAQRRMSPTAKAMPRGSASMTASPGPTSARRSPRPPLPAGPPPAHLRSLRVVTSPPRRPQNALRERSRSRDGGGGGSSTFHDSQNIPIGVGSSFRDAYGVGSHRAAWRAKAESMANKGKGGKPGAKIDLAESKGDKGNVKGDKGGAAAAAGEGGPPRGKTGLKGDKLGGKGGTASSRRGGWFNRCQQLCEAILALDSEESMRLAEEFYSGSAEVWVGTEFVWSDAP